jgi:hypothetical protein
VLTSTLVTAPAPDQARPSSIVGPAARRRARVMKSGIPGGRSSERGRIRVTGAPGTPSVPYSR